MNCFSINIYPANPNNELRGTGKVVQAEEWNDEVPLRGILQVVQVSYNEALT